MAKKTVILCDDQQRFRDEFVSRHSSHYEIICVSDTADLMDVIEKQKNLPDIILLDLYHPTDLDATFEQRRLDAEASLSKLDAQIEETNQAVLRAWEPLGLDVLRLIREKYPSSELPVAIYTQKGLILLNDEQLRMVEELEGNWLLKKKLSAHTEQISIDRIIHKEKHPKVLPSKKPSAAYRWILGFSWLIIGVLAARLFFNTDQLSDIIAAVVLGVISALATLVVTPLVEGAKKNQE